MITQAQRNAALLAAHTQVLAIIDHMVPAMFKAYAESYINANPQLIANISDAVLNAADSVKPSIPPIKLPPPLHPVPEATNVQHPSS